MQEQLQTKTAAPELSGAAVWLSMKGIITESEMQSSPYGIAKAPGGQHRNQSNDNDTAYGQNDRRPA